MVRLLYLTRNRSDGGSGYDKRPAGTTGDVIDRQDLLMNIS